MTNTEKERHADPTPQVFYTCSGQGLKRLAAAGLAWLEQHHEMVNALNVFPVPDGDTGTNMLLTLRSAYREIADNPNDHAGQIASLLYNGALLGARGNSGVILSQLLRGFANGVEDEPAFDAGGMIRAFQEAVRIAYGAVQEPVEGTILTVAREMAEEAVLADQDTKDLYEILRRIVVRAHDSVSRTPELLDVLREAGVVDAGGMGLAYILEGMLRHLNGEPLEVSDVLGEELHLQHTLEPGESAYPYDVQFILKGQRLNIASIRADIEKMGDSTLVVGDANTIKVHVHVEDPGVPLSYGATLGTLSDVIVENMQEQYQEWAMAHGEAHAAQHIEKPTIQEGHIAVITVAPGNGLERIFYSLGAAHVIPGGQTMNPSTEQFVNAIGTIPTNRIILLPNNKNILMAAEAAAELSSGKEVVVIPTRTIPQGITALLTLDPEGELSDVAAAMSDMMNEVETGEVTTATRNAKVDGIKIKKGQIIGLHNDRMCVAGDDLEGVVIDLLEAMGTPNHELITLYYGIDVTRKEAEALAERLADVFHDQELEIKEGGQAHYFYIMSVE
jgi:DAK2 domain fusion protein YloV